MNKIPCFTNAQKSEKLENKEFSTSTALTTSLVLAIIVGLGTLLAAYAITRGCLPTHFIIGGTTALITGIASFIFFRCLLGQKRKDQMDEKSEAKDVITPIVQKELPISPEKQEKAVKLPFPPIEHIRSYPGDLTKQEKASLNYELTDNILKISFSAHPSFSISIRAQDIFESGAEVIVNAANTDLVGGSGIDGEIHRKGGNTYSMAHLNLQAHYKAQYTNGFAVMITSGNLKASCNIDNVIVVAGPLSPPTLEKEKQLYSCYYNSLVLADREGKKSIAFPAISTGQFGFSQQRAACISLKALYDFINRDEPTILKTISIHFRKNEKDLLKNYQDALTE